MERLTFEVLGSRDDIYTVTFEKGGEKLHAFCTCQAGQNRTYCKHRFSLMNGESGHIVSDNKDDLERLRVMLQGTELEEKYIAVFEAERVYATSKRELDKAKIELARAMYR